MFQRRFFETHETLTFLTRTDVLFTENLRYNMTFAREKTFFVIPEKLEHNVFSLGILFDKKIVILTSPLQLEIRVRISNYT